MNEYIIHNKMNLYKSIANGFLQCIGIFIASFVFSYFIFQKIHTGCIYIITEPFDTRDGVSLVLSCVKVLFPCTVLLCAVLLSAFTVLGRAVSVICAVWRGSCLGCLTALVGVGAVFGTNTTIGIGLSLYFISTVLMLILSSCASVYAKCICKGHSEEKYSETFSLSVEFIKLFLIISGAIYITYLISIIFI